MDKDFVECNSTNCPRVDFMMVHEFIKTQNTGEVAGSSKEERSSRPSYGDKAVGMVQLKREGSVCCVKARVTPEHRIRNQAYSVTCMIDEDSDNPRVISAECDDCPASQGGCKHRIAFIMWLHRRSEEPAPTEVTSYWKKSVLSKEGTAPIAISGISKRNSNTYNVPTASEVDSFKTAVLAKASDKSACKVFSTCMNVVDIHTLVKHDFGEFVSGIKVSLLPSTITQVESETQDQASSEKWHLAHYGRITASKFYNVAHCKTAEGSMVNSILGGKTPETKAMKRGSVLEDRVFKLIKNKFPDMRKCGLFLHEKYPLFGASPDGIGKDYVVEIKCPSSEKTVVNYVRDGKITAKYEYQIQLQMAMTERKKGYFVVADPGFERNSQFILLEVTYNEKLVSENVTRAVQFYKENVFPHLI